MTTAKDLLIESLCTLGADGLCHEDCGCGIDDLAPCQGSCLDCVPARRTTVGAERALGVEIDLDLEDDDVWFAPHRKADHNERMTPDEWNARMKSLEAEKATQKEVLDAVARAAPDVDVESTRYVQDLFKGIWDELR